jgi:purine-cytosine permease-like protein
MSDHHSILDEIPGGEAELELEIKHDYSSSHDGIVPLNVRRGTWTHHVPLWITLYAGFSYMALGSELYALGYRLSQMLLVVLVSSVCYLAYAIPSAYLGAVKGQTHALMGRSVFGLTGSMIVSAFVLVAPLGWVGYQANTLSIMWNSLYGWTPVVWIGVAIAVIGIINNVLGFTGISAFARWVAAPVTVVWVAYMVIKAFVSTDSSVLHSTASGVTASPLALGIISALGFATYGNEPDLFRYAKPEVKAVVPPLAIGLFVGQILFPLAGWVIGARISSPDFGKGFAEAVSFSLFGLSLLAVLLATATQVAVNDANYYESLNAGQNLFGGWAKWRRIYTCLLIAAGGGFMAWWVPQNFSNFFRVTTWLAVSVPTATVIMYVDQLLLPRLLKGYTRRMDKVPAWDQVAKGNWPGIVTLLVAVSFGAYGSGVFPGQAGSPLDGWGIVPVEAWILAAILYTALVALTWRLPNGKSILGFPQTALESEPAAATASGR